MCKANKWRHSCSCILITNKLLVSDNSKADLWQSKLNNAVCSPTQYIWLQVCQLYKQWHFNLCYIKFYDLAKEYCDTANESLFPVKVTLLTFSKNHGLITALEKYDQKLLYQVLKRENKWTSSPLTMFPAPYFQTYSTFIFQLNIQPDHEAPMCQVKPQVKQCIQLITHGLMFLI